MADRTPWPAVEAAPLHRIEALVDAQRDYAAETCSNPWPDDPEQRDRHWHRGHDMHECHSGCPTPGSPAVCTGCGAPSPTITRS